MVKTQVAHGQRSIGSDSVPALDRQRGGLTDPGAVLSSARAKVLNRYTVDAPDSISDFEPGMLGRSPDVNPDDGVVAIGQEAVIGVVARVDQAEYAENDK